MNYYNEIKTELINNEVYKKVKDYSKNRSDINTYYNVGKLLSEAGKHYGDRIIKEYSNKLTLELGKGYSERNLYNMKLLYEKLQTVSAKLSWSHYCEILSFEEEAKINYYIKTIEEQNLSIRELRNKIKVKEYERLDENTKTKLISKVENNVQDFIKNPILIKNSYDHIEISEKVLKRLILEDIDNFLTELGNNFCYIKNEYKIKLGDKYNYIDLLLYNIEYNCYVIIELKVTELKKEHIGQIQTYMNYIDKNIKKVDQDSTIGIIICKKENNYIMEYCSDKRILCKEYKIINI
jgi:predicted nuclease of restriction endonuclease-like (RecB) superfamily